MGGGGFPLSLPSSRPHKSRILVVLLVLLTSGPFLLQSHPPAVLAQTAPNVYYVHPATGSDSNSGTVTSPFRTVQKALDVVQPGDTVMLAEATYNETLQTV